MSIPHSTKRRQCESRGAVLVALAFSVTGALAFAQGAPTGQAPDGAKLYRTYCASCHGVSGRGDGPMAEYLRVPPTNLTRLAPQHGGTFSDDAVASAIDGRKRIGSHGPSDMPVWGDAFSSPLAAGGEAALRERVRAVVRHLASLQERPAP